METAGQQEGIEVLRRAAAGLTAQGIVPEEGGAGLFVGLEHGPGEQGAHVELGHPGALEHRQGQVEAEITASQLLGPGNEVLLVLQSGEALQDRHDAIEGILDAAVVGTQSSVLDAIGQRMLPCRCEGRDGSRASA